MDQSALRKFTEQEITSYHSLQSGSTHRDQSAADHVRRALKEKGVDVAVPRDLFEKVLAEELAKHDEN